MSDDDTNQWPLRLRPHHVLCSIGFRGHGYSDGFVANMTAVVDGILQAPGGDKTPVNLTADADDICGPCTRRRGKCCGNELKISQLDARHAAALGITPGSQHTWGELKARAKSSVAPSDLDWLCADCQWLPMGLCKDALAELRGNVGKDADATDAAPDPLPDPKA